MDEPKAPPPGGPSETPAKPAPGEGAAPPAPPKAVGPPPKPAAAKPPTKPEPWSSPLLDHLQEMFPGAVSDPQIFRDQPSITLGREFLLAVGEFLKSEEGGEYKFLTDETAVDYPKREKRFDVVYHLYSFAENNRLRLKVIVGEGEKV